MDLAIIGPVGIRRHNLEKICHESAGHTHNYDHTTIVIHGRLKVTYSHQKDGQWIDGGSIEYSQGEAFCVKANVRHTLKALEVNTAYMCVFSHRDFGGLVSQNYVGNAAAYH